MSADQPPFGKACYGRSARGRCAVKPSWVTTQDGGANPIFACGRHLVWVAALRTSPGYSLTITRLTGGSTPNPTEATAPNAPSFASCEPLCIRGEHTESCVRNREQP